MKTITVNLPLLKSLLTLATVIEAKDPCTGGHIWRVSRYAKKLAEKYGLSTDEVFLTYLGGLVHDIGKVGIPDGILNKKDKLTKEEFEVIKKHPGVGKTLTIDHPLEGMIMDVIIEHHERYDGNGYPNRKKGDESTLRARIVAIADAFDAMTSTRPYRPGMQPNAAFNIIMQESGKQFDPMLAAKFVSMGKAGEIRHILGHSSEERPMMTCSVCGPIIVAPRYAEDGTRVVCPGCAGNFVLHASGDSFEAEWLGNKDNAWVPQPDEDTVEEAMSLAPGKVKL